MGADADGDAIQYQWTIKRRDGTVLLCYVAPESQRLGAATRMLAALETAAAGWELQSLQLQSTLTAKSFYERSGYTAAGVPVTVCATQLAYPMRKVIAA